MGFKAGPTSKEELRQIFKRYDINQDNQLSRKELKQAFDTLGAHFPAFRAGRGLSHADANNDGKINLDHELDNLVNYAYKLGYTVSH